MDSSSSDTFSNLTLGASCAVIRLKKNNEIINEIVRIFIMDFVGYKKKNG